MVVNGTISLQAARYSYRPYKECTTYCLLVILSAFACSLATCNKVTYCCSMAAYWLAFVGNANVYSVTTCSCVILSNTSQVVQYIPRNMHTVFALLRFVVVIHWLIFPYPSGLLHWHCGNLTIAPVPAKQPWWIWTSTSCEFIMNDCITTTKQSTTKSCAYFLGYTVPRRELVDPGITLWNNMIESREAQEHSCCSTP